MDGADPEKDPDFAKARVALKKAKNVVFLGFGYHRENIERLKLDEYRDPKMTWYYGTAVGLSSQKRKDIQALFSGRFGIKLDPQRESPNVLAFISNHPDLFR